jgi:aspartate/methionine/tyrosine aminotransferase
MTPAMLDSAWLGGGLNRNIVAGRLAGMIEKRHLVLKRWFLEHAKQHGRSFIDLGTDYAYPFYDEFRPTQLALHAIAERVASARHYPSSYGTLAAREEFVAFMRRRFGVVCDPHRDVMVSTGASQIFDAVSRTYAGDVVLVPELALSTVTSIASGNGGRIVRIPYDASFEPDLKALDELIADIGPDNIRFVYVNSPTNPTGTVLSRRYLTDLVALARRHHVLVVHDHDSWYTVHTGEPSVNILEIPGAAEVAITVLSVSKELGLPGIRVGFVAGNPDVINDLRIHNSEFCVMIPEFCQAAAVAALQASVDDDVREEVQQRIAGALDVAVRGWRRLGWPAEAIWYPKAGYKFLVRPPEQFARLRHDDVTGVELFDFLIGRDAAAKLSTSRSFNPEWTGWMRMIVMQEADVMDDFFQRIDDIGVHYRMRPPPDLGDEFQALIAQCDLWDL